MFSKHGQNKRSCLATTRPVGLHSVARHGRAARRWGFTLLELLAVVTILGIIAVIVVPRVTTTSTAAKQKAHLHNKAVINAAVERYFVTEGSWPSADLNELEPPGTYDYFPDGIPVNPVDGSAYAIDATTHRVP